MGIKNFINNGIDTTKKIYEAGTETIEKEKLSVIKFFGKALKQSSIGAYYVFLKAEIDGIIKKNEIENTVNDTSEKIAYLIGGYYLHPATLLNLKKELESKGINTQIINERYYSKKSIGDNVKELKNRMKKDEGKDIVLFGYSAGGVIAHRIGEKNGYNSVSFGTSEIPKETMVGTLLSLTKDEEIKDISIPENGVNIIETFSGMVPNLKDDSKHTIRLNNVYSHMTIGKEEVISEITKQILMGFKNERI